MSDNKKRRTILIGIDGAAWSLLDKFIGERKLPVFARLKKEGSWGVLKSTIPCYSPLAWNSIFSGVNPAKHGIWGFVEHLYGSLDLRPLNSTDRKYPALWNYTDYRGIDSTFVNIPFSFPLEVTKGIFISGLGVPFQNYNYSYPLHFKSYIKKNYPDYRIDFDEKLMSRKKDKDYFSAECLRILDSRLALARELLIKDSWQLFCLVIRAMDIFQHFCWDDQELMVKAYEKIDNFLSFVMDNMRGDDTLMIVSDHGFSRLKKMIYLVNFFLKEGYMVTRPRAKLKRGVDLQLLQNIILRVGGAKLLEVLKRNYRLRNLFFRFSAPDKFSYMNSIDWHSSLLSYAEGSGGIAHFNPEFRADQQRLNSFFTGLREKALNLCDEEGCQVFEGIYKGSELYGPRAPDIIFRVNSGYCVSSYNPYDNSIFGKSSYYIGMHDENGIILLFNDKIKKGYTLKPHSVYDVLPTVLNLLNLDIPDYLDGKVLTEAFSEEVSCKQIPLDKDIFMGKQKAKVEFSDKDEETVRQRLKSLGYL